MQILESTSESTLKRSEAFVTSQSNLWLTVIPRKQQVKSTSETLSDRFLAEFSFDKSLAELFRPLCHRKMPIQ